MEDPLNVIKWLPYGLKGKKINREMYQYNNVLKLA